MKSNNFEQNLVAALKGALAHRYDRLDDKWRDEAEEALKAIEDRDAEPEGEPTNQEYIEAARAAHGEDGECEIDDDAVVSRGDDLGAYVQAWVFVYKSYIDSEKYGEDKV